MATPRIDAFKTLPFMKNIGDSLQTGLRDIGKGFGSAIEKENDPERKLKIEELNKLMADKKDLKKVLESLSDTLVDDWMAKHADDTDEQVFGKSEIEGPIQEPIQGPFQAIDPVTGKRAETEDPETAPTPVGEGESFDRGIPESSPTGLDPIQPDTSTQRSSVESKESLKLNTLREQALEYKAVVDNDLKSIRSHKDVAAFVNGEAMVESMLIDHNNKFPEAPIVPSRMSASQKIKLGNMKDPENSHFFKSIKRKRMEYMEEKIGDLVTEFSESNAKANDALDKDGKPIPKTLDDFMEFVQKTDPRLNAFLKTQEGKRVVSSTFSQSTKSIEDQRVNALQKKEDFEKKEKAKTANKEVDIKTALLKTINAEITDMEQKMIKKNAEFTNKNFKSGELKQEAKKSKILFETDGKAFIKKKKILTKLITSNPGVESDDLRVAADKFAIDMAITEDEEDWLEAGGYDTSKIKVIGRAEPETESETEEEPVIEPVIEEDPLEPTVPIVEPKADVVKETDIGPGTKENPIPFEGTPEEWQKFAKSKKGTNVHYVLVGVKNEKTGKDRVLHIR